MRESTLLELAVKMGHSLAMAGAETYRIEESILRILNAYGFEAEAFAIPNCLTVSIITEDGTPMTRMRRIGTHGTDLGSVERFNALSRRICSEVPDPETAMQWLDELVRDPLRYGLAMRAAGYFLGSFGFSIVFGGVFSDALWAGICGLIVLGVDIVMDRFRSTLFLRTISSAFICSLTAYIVHALGFLANPDACIIGTLMLLVPGLLFTNAMRDIMYGDTNSGIHRIVQVLLIAMAIALGTAGAMQLVTAICGTPFGSGLARHGFLMLNVGSLIGCVGFSLVFNIHSLGIVFCSLGGVLSWSAYLLSMRVSGDVIVSSFVGGLVSSAYAEIMARIRKYPAISYLVVAIFPLIPGAGVYYTMCYAVEKNMEMFSRKGFETAGVAGSIALGILLVSTVFRMWSEYRRQKAR